MIFARRSLIALFALLLLPGILWAQASQPDRPSHDPWDELLHPKVPTDAEVNATLDKNIPEVRFFSIPLESGLTFLRDYSQFNLAIDWSALEAAGVDRKSEVTLQLRDLPTRTCLATLLVKATGRFDLLDFVVRDGKVFISTVEKLDQVLTTRSYDCAALKTADANWRANLLAAIRTVFEPMGEDFKPGDARSRPTWEGTALTVTTSERCHRQIARLLVDLAAPGTSNAADAKVNALLDKNIPEVRFIDIPFESALNFLRDYVRMNILPFESALSFLRDYVRMNILPNWAALEDAGVTPRTSVTMTLKNRPLRDVLAELLRVAGGEVKLAMATLDGVLWISTPADLERISEVVVYDIGPEIEGMPARESALLASLNAPTRQGDGTTRRTIFAASYNGRLAVLASPVGHRTVAAEIAKLSMRFRCRPGRRRSRTTARPTQSPPRTRVNSSP